MYVNAPIFAYYFTRRKEYFDVSYGSTFGKAL